jgi:hypothetical protein
VERNKPLETDKIFDGIQWREISHKQLIRYLMEYSGEK